LDAWIDRHLFQGGQFVRLMKRGLWYRPDAKGYTSDVGEAGRYTLDEAMKLIHPDDEPVTMHKFPVPHYSTDPAAAMQVLEKCLSTKLAFGATLQSTPSGFAVSMAIAGHYNSTAETLPLAIC